MEPEAKSNGAFIGGLVIVLLLVVGGYYAWQSSVKEKAATEAQKQAELNSILSGSELDASINSLDQELETIEADLGVDIEGLE